MTYPSPPPMRSHTALIAFGVLAVVLLVCCGGGLAWFLNSRPEATSAGSTPPPDLPDPFDQAAFDTYWAGNASDNVQGYVTSVDWDGTALTAHTKLYADSDAVQPAKDICTALGGFWLGQDFHPVRVLDGADQILVSRHTRDDTCTWRR